LEINSLKMCISYTSPNIKTPCTMLGWVGIASFIRGLGCIWLQKLWVGLGYGKSTRVHDCSAHYCKLSDGEPPACCVLAWP